MACAYSGLVQVQHRPCTNLYTLYSRNELTTPNRSIYPQKGCTNPGPQRHGYLSQTAGLWAGAHFLICTESCAYCVWSASTVSSDAPLDRTAQVVSHLVHQSIAGHCQAAGTTKNTGCKVSQPASCWRCQGPMAAYLTSTFPSCQCGSPLSHRDQQNQ